MPRDLTRMRARLDAYRIALRRRFALWTRGEFHPYPAAPRDIELSPSEAHSRALDTSAVQLAWTRSGSCNARTWQATAREKLVELVGYPMGRPIPSGRYRTDHSMRDGFHRRRIYLRLWNGGDAPIDVVWRTETQSPPVMICLQGTNSGSHLSWGEVLLPPDPEKVSAGGDYARQAARRGYLAVCLEQSCFGERQERHLRPHSASPTIDAANHAFLLGRSLIGERAGDVSSVVDWLLADGAHRDLGLRIDRERIFVMGSSAGGTVALYAAALDERIGAVLASGCLGFIRDTIARRRDDSAQNVIPGILKWLETDDVVGLVAPRPFLAISGTRDHIFPSAGVSAVVDSAQKIYRAFNAADVIAAVSAEGPHRFYPDVAWPAFQALVGRLPSASAT